MRVVTSKQMKEIEQRSLNYDLTFQRLMENAGSAAAAHIRRTFKVQGLNIMVFCGGGNNGGDGLVVARKLFESGAHVLIVLVNGEPKGAEPAAMFRTAQALELPIADFDLNRGRVLEIMEEADIIVDAIYGTGFHSKLNDRARAACAAINEAIAAVVALDLPSGLNCDAATSDPDAVRADFTIVFDSLKPCHVLPAGQELCGVIETVDIGIPEECHEGMAARFGSLTTPQVFEHLPVRDPNSHKGTYGKLLSICGSSHYRGAAALSAMGALRSGAGIVTLASTEAVCFTVASRIPEATFLPLEEGLNGEIDGDAALDILDRPVRNASAILIGCGIEQGRHTERILEHVLQHAACPVIIDADGINTVAGNINILKEAKAPVILTPHPGEMGRLCGKTVAEVESDRGSIATRFARDNRVILVLKGHETLIADPEGGLFLNNTGNPGLAKGGSGDILAGMISSFAAQGVEPVYAAACAVHLHGLAADRTAARRSQYAMLPSELLDDLADIFAEQGR